MLDMQKEEEAGQREKICEVRLERTWGLSPGLLHGSVEHCTGQSASHLTVLLMEVCAGCPVPILPLSKQVLDVSVAHMLSQGI